MCLAVVVRTELESTNGSAARKGHRSAQLTGSGIKKTSSVFSALATIYVFI